MKVLDLIRLEINLLNPVKVPNPSPDDTYFIHCSMAVLNTIHAEFLESGFLIPPLIPKEEIPKSAKFQFPYIGYLELYPDQPNGYTITKI